MGELKKKEDNSNVKATLLKPAMLQAIAQTLPSCGVSPQRLARLGIAAVTRDPKLAECSEVSVIGSLMQCATLGLEPNTPLGLAWILPYWNGKARRMDAQLIVGYQGMIDLARRSGRLASLRAHIVREGDDFEYALGLDISLTHKPKTATGPLKAVYAVAKLVDAGADPLIEVMTREELEAHRDRFAPRDKDKRIVGPWISDFEAMCLKTAARRLWKWLPKSTEAAQALTLEAAAEKGSQAAAWDDGVRQALVSNLGEGSVEQLAAESSAIEYDAETGEVTEPKPKPDPKPAKSAAHKAVTKGERVDDVDMSGAMRDIFNLANEGKVTEARELFEAEKPQLPFDQQDQILEFLAAVESAHATKKSEARNG